MRLCPFIWQSVPDYSWWPEIMSAGSGCDKTCQEVLTRFVQHHDGRATAVDETKWPCNNVASM
jgi:hypothetical protein